MITIILLSLALVAVLTYWSVSRGKSIEADEAHRNILSLLADQQDYLDDDDNFGI